MKPNISGKIVGNMIGITDATLYSNGKDSRPPRENGSKNALSAAACAERALGCCVRGQPEGNLSFIGDPSAGNGLVPRATDFISDISTGAAHRSDRPGEVSLHRRAMSKAFA